MSMKCVLNYGKIEKLYRKRGSGTDEDFCIAAGINPDSYKSRKESGKECSLIVAALIADYLQCHIDDIIKLVR